jgi:hypothetical protein
MTIPKKTELYRTAILSGNKKEAQRLLEEINAEIAARYTRPKKQSISNIVLETALSNAEVSALTIYEFLNNTYKDEWWDWEIETLESEVKKRFGITITDENIDKIQALKTVISNSEVFKDWFYFNQVAVGISGAVADFNNLKYPSPGMVIAAARAMKAIRPGEEFGSEVKSFIAVVLKDHGIYMPAPTIFDLLIDVMEVSAEMKSQWPDIIERMKMMLVEDNDEDDMVSVQARRIINAEKAAEKYGG